MARGCLTAFLIVVVLIIGLFAVVGPTVYREGRAIAEPIAQMARSEKQLDALDAEFPFTPPDGDAEVSEQRLLEFFEIRHQLKPLYEAWSDTVETVQREHGDSWRGAKPVLSATRDAMTGQIRALRHGRMSPREFRWLEDVVYHRWRSAQDDTAVRTRRDVVRQLTAEDLEIVSGLESRHGSDSALRELRNHLERRLATVLDPALVPVPGVSLVTQELLWRYRDTVDELDLADHDLHSALSRRGGTTIAIGDRRLEFDD